MTKKQRRASGPIITKSPLGDLPWRPRDVTRTMDDGSTELVAHAVIDRHGNEIIHDMPDDVLRQRLLTAVNRDLSDGGKTLTAKEAYLDPMSILEDSVDILSVALEAREAYTEEKDPVLRDLIKRIRGAVHKSRSA